MAIDVDNKSTYCLFMYDSQEPSVTTDGYSPRVDSVAISQTGNRERIVELIRALLGMSRALVAVFVVAHAGLASIFATGRLPGLFIIITGIFACLFGTGALIGLNDLLDVKLDRRRIASEKDAERLDLGSLFIHHPVAKGVISMTTGIIWVGVLAALSLVLIYMLKPTLWPIFVLIAISVALYSILGWVTYWKFLAVATAVTLGALAGWLVVAEANTTTFLLFGAWTFLWEIGGRNIPNDFNDVDEDKALGVKTIPVILGRVAAGRIVFFTLVASFLLSIPLMILAEVPLFFIITALVSGAYLLLIPGYALMRDPRPEISRLLYNKSAIYPLILLMLLMANLLLVR